MKSFLLYGPLLWLRKVILYLLGIGIVLGLALYFVANSPFVIKKVAEHFAPDYNITYSRIYGSVVTGIEIDNLAYNHQPLAEYMALHWNPNGLINKKIIVSNLEIKKANIDTIERLIEAFSSDENESVTKDNSESLEIELHIKHAALSVAPLSRQGVSITTLHTDIWDVSFAQDTLEVAKATLSMKSDITDIHIDANLESDALVVKRLEVKKLDPLVLQRLFESQDEPTSIDNDENVTQKTAVETESKNPFIPKWVKVNSLEIDTTPFYYEPVDIKSFKVQGRDAVFDLEKLLLEEAKIDVNTTTNLSNIVYSTMVKENKLVGNVAFKPKKKLFDYLELPIRHEAVGDIVLDLNVSKKEVEAQLDISMKQLLQGTENDFNLDIDNLHSHLMYDIQKGTMQLESRLRLTTPYAKNVAISNILEMEEVVTYRGEINIDNITGVEEKFTKLLHDLKINYSGDTKRINAKIDAQNMSGTLDMPDFKQGHLSLHSKAPMMLRDFVELPTELNQTEAELSIEVPLSFEENATYIAHANMNSNLINLDTNISYDENLKVVTLGHIPEDSLLKTFSQDVKWNRLNPIRTHLKLENKNMDFTLDAGEIKGNLHYVLEANTINGQINIDELRTVLSGKVDEDLTISTHITSLESVVTSVDQLYSVETLPKLYGSADIAMHISKLESVNVTLGAPQIIYEAGKESRHHINDISLDIFLDSSQVVLKQYAFTYENQKLFSTKPSKILLEDQNITIAPVWLNDSLEIIAEYDLNVSRGEVNATAQKLQIEHDLASVDSKIDIDTKLDGNKTAIKGQIVILGGNIYYDLGQNTYASDSDILIVQELHEEEPSSFMEHLTVDVQVKSEEPLVYKKGPIDIEAKADLGVYKVEKGELMLLGSVELLKGGSYVFEGKKFVLDKSFIHFTGDPQKPLIEAVVNYQALNHLITITVSGAPDTLHINFSSVPSLSREEILSIILFDSQEGAGTNSGQDMMKMMGGAMAKSALADLGVELDHLVLGSGNSIEVGKKLTDEMTIIYVNDVVAGVKLKYEHTEKLESVISADEESQSYDIIYKRDF